MGGGRGGCACTQPLDLRDVQGKGSDPPGTQTDLSEEFLLEAGTHSVNPK